MTEIDIAVLRAINEIVNRTGRKYAKSNDIIAEASKSLGNWSLSVDNELRNEGACGDETVAGIYNRLIEMIIHKRFAIGQGNFGCPNLPPAHPKFTECAITSEGVEYLKNAAASAHDNTDGA